MIWKNREVEFDLSLMSPVNNVDDMYGLWVLWTGT
jgi:hypothetical protein